MTEIQIRLHRICSIVHPTNGYALILEEVNGSRKLPIIINSLEARTIKAAMKESTLPSSPADLLTQLTTQLDIKLKRMLIHKVQDGLFYSLLYFQQNEREVILNAQTPDAMGLAFRYEAPLYVTDSLIESEQLREIGDGAFSISINMVDVTLLQEELDRAIKNENYEKASQLRDEIARRESASNKK
ncbi:MAG: bifunctional nuclease domain-containing protein [Phocaeicola sp.]